MQQHRQPFQRQVPRASNKSSVKVVLQKVGNPTETILDEAVWSRGLPDQIFCMILACLPFSSFFRLQCVCKKWSLIAQDPIFISAYARVSIQAAYLCLASRDGFYWIYEEGLIAWKCIPPSFFCPKLLEGTWSPIAAVGSRLLLTKSSGRGRHMLAKTSGDYSEQNYSFAVYNPLNGTHEALPPMVAVHPAGQRGRYDIPYTAEMSSKISVKDIPVKPLETYYKFLVMIKNSNMLDDSDGEDERLRFREYSTIHVQVYDSRTSEWDVKEIPDHDNRYDVLSVALFRNALIYLTLMNNLFPFRDYAIVNDLVMSEITSDFLGWERDTYEWDLDGEIAQYHFLKRDQALKVVTAHVFVTRGRLILAAAVPCEKAHNEILPKWKSIMIWEKVGNKMTRVAEIDLTKLGPRPHRRIHHFSLGAFLLSKGDSLYFCSDAEDLFGIIDIGTKTWRLLPSFPGQKPTTINGKYEPFVYQPGFDLAA